ncbi:MAG: efflux RND transporter periplasmic adaptor subunit [Campylobacterales bacterium]|nr:efflux RND transporter periplasmic adaptor subunit [Campylobacterales bacterium]
MNLYKRYIKIVFLGTLLIFGLSGCSDSDSTKNKNAPALPVQTVKIEHHDVFLEKIYAAEIEPYKEVTIIARVQGVLEEQHFKEGSFVKEGASLYTIEQDTYRAKLDFAKAKHNQTLNDYKRAQKLYKTKAISDKDYDNFLASYEDAKANLKLAQLDFDYTEIKAPISGIVGIKKMDVGNFIQANTPLTTITATDPIYVNFSISKNDAGRFIAQLKEPSIVVKIIKNNGEKSKTSGKIDYIAPQLDATTNTLQLRAIFDNSDNEFIAGDFTEVALEGLKIPNAITIPEQAIFQTQNGAIIYVVEDNIAKLRPVTPDILTPKGIIVTGPLKDGEDIIINNIMKIRPDTKVAIMQEEGK